MHPLAGSRPCLFIPSDMVIVTEPMPRSELTKYAAASFGQMVKAVVDVERALVAVDAGMHSDLEQFLLEDGSLQSDLWGINLYPKNASESFLEFDSMINLRPPEGNFTRGVDSLDTQARIRQIIERVFPE